MEDKSYNCEAIAYPAKSDIRLSTTCAVAVFLSKLAKHLLVIACLTILGRAAGRLVIDQLAIFGLIAVATTAQFVGSALQTRLSKQARLSLHQP